jgi:hypothetical protein
LSIAFRVSVCRNADAVYIDWPWRDSVEAAGVRTLERKLDYWELPARLGLLALSRLCPVFDSVRRFACQSQYVPGVIVAVVIGVALRLWFSVGFVGGFPQDDGIYVNLARMLASGSDLTERYHHLLPTYLANPAENFTFRIAFLYPLSWCFRLFGEGDGPATALPILSAAISIVTIAEIARTAISPAAGIGAAMLLALLPHDVILTSRVLTDGQLRMFIALACFGILRGWEKGSTTPFWGAGVALGFAYLTKISGAAVFAVFGIILVIRYFKLRSSRTLVAYALGFTDVFAGEAVWYWWKTGEPFLHYRIVHSSILSKLQFEPMSVADFGRQVRVIWEGEFLWYAPFVLGLTAIGYYSFAGFGVQGWVWLSGLFLAARSKKSEARALLLIAVVLYLFIEFFPLDVRLADGRLSYALVYRQWRFASLLTPAWVPLGGAVLAWLWDKSRVAASLLLAICIVTGGPQLLRMYRVLRGSQADLRAAAAFIVTRPERVYTDGLARSTLQYYAGSASVAASISDISVLGESVPAKGALVITGGSRSIELLSAAWEPGLPTWCRALLGWPDEGLPGWRLLLRVRGRVEATRLHDLLILQYVGT